MFTFCCSGCCNARLSRLLVLVSLVPFRFTYFLSCWSFHSNTSNTNTVLLLVSFRACDKLCLLMVISFAVTSVAIVKFLSFGHLLGVCPVSPHLLHFLLYIQPLYQVVVRKPCRKFALLIAWSLDLSISKILVSL